MVIDKYINQIVDMEFIDGNRSRKIQGRIADYDAHFFEIIEGVDYGKLNTIGYQGHDIFSDVSKQGGNTQKFVEALCAVYSDQHRASNTSVIPRSSVSKIVPLIDTNRIYVVEQRRINETLKEAQVNQHYMKYSPTTVNIHFYEPLMRLIDKIKDGSIIEMPIALARDELERAKKLGESVEKLIETAKRIAAERARTLVNRISESGIVPIAWARGKNDWKLEGDGEQIPPLDGNKCYAFILNDDVLANMGYVAVLHAKLGDLWEHIFGTPSVSNVEFKREWQKWKK